MANTKISSLTALTTAASGDLLATVDISDTSMASSGTTKKITLSNLATSIGSLSTTWSATQKFADGVYSDTVASIASDSVATFTPPSNNYMVFLAPYGSSGTPFGIIAVTLSGATTVLVVSSATTLATMNDTVLTGTTGTSGNVTVSHSGGTLYIENRRSFGINYTLFYISI